MSDCCNEFEFTSPQGTFYMDGGIRGKDGVTFYPHVSAAGILSWTNDGGKQNPDPVNIKGADGMSAYAAAQQAGFTGTEQEFNAYLSGIGELTEDVDDLKSAINDPVSGLDSKAPAIFDTASGAIASFEDGADGMPLKGLTINIEPVQAGEGDPSPENVRPITGWTGCNVARTGKNLFDGIVESGFLDLTTGEPVANATNRYRCKNFIRVLPNTTYSIKNSDNAIDTASIRIYFYDKNKKLISTPNGSTSNYNITTPATCAYIKFFVNQAIDNYDNTICIVSGRNDFDYVPSQVATYPITFPSEAGTVYGGTLDVVNKKLTIDSACIKANWGDGYNQTTIGAYERRRFYSERYNIDNFDKWISSITDDIRSTGYSGDYLHITAMADSSFISVFLPVGTDDTTIIDVCYPLRTPITYSLTLQEITTLLGTNNIWADCGDVSAEYPADTKLYIQKINAPTDDDMTADTQIESGKYFLIGNTLYLSTTVIPAGDTINPGTNCTKTNLAEALNALNT